MTVAESDTLNKLTPWARALAILTGLHVVCVIIFWKAVVSGGSGGTANFFAWALIPIYPVEIGIAFFIQKRLKELQHVSSGAWQVIVGGILLNPFAIGWWIPVSVLFSLTTARRKARDSEA